MEWPQAIGFLVSRIGLEDESPAVPFTPGDTALPVIKCHQTSHGLDVSILKITRAAGTDGVIVKGWGWG